MHPHEREHVHGVRGGVGAGDVEQDVSVGTNLVGLLERFDAFRVSTLVDEGHTALEVASGLGLGIGSGRPRDRKDDENEGHA